MLKKKKNKTINRSLPNQKVLIGSVVFCCHSNQDENFEEDIGYQVLNWKKVSRKGEIGMTAEFADNDSHHWRVTMFPIGQGIFEGDVEWEDQTGIVVIVNSNNMPETPISEDMQKVGQK